MASARGRFQSPADHVFQVPFRSPVLFTVLATAFTVAAACSPRTRAPAANPPEQAELSQTSSALGTSPASWTAQGPAPGAARQPVDNVTVPNAFKFDVSGAVHFLLVDPTNTATVYAGSASGGVFKADGTTGPGVDSASVLAGNRVHWIPTTDGLSSLSISAMAIDPTNHLHIVAGTGQVSNFGAHGVQGLIHVTSDGGTTWTSVTQTPMRGTAISGLAVRGQFMLATTTGSPGGVLASTDGGLTWQSRAGLHPSDPNDLPAAIGPAWDVAADPTDSNRYYVVVAGQNNGNTTTGSGLYLGTGLGSAATTSWKRISDNDAATPTNQGLPHALATTGSSGGKLAVASNGRLYVASWALGQPVFIGFTPDQGGHWTRMETPRFPLSATSSGKININRVTRDAGSVVIVVETVGDHGLDLSGHGRVRIDGVTGFADALGDWRVGSFTESGATSPSKTKFTLQDRFSGAEGDGIVGNGSGGQAVGTGGTVQPWNDINTNGQTSNVALAIDPTSADTVYLAGDHDSSFAGLGPTQQAANIVRGDATDPNLGQIPTAAWTFITGNQTPSKTTPHGDIRHLAFNSKNELLLSSDGGIFLHPNPRGSADWINLNGDLNGLEIHDLAFDPLSMILTGATQDNGVPEQPSPGATTPWTVVALPPNGDGANGDGGDVQSVVESSDPTKSKRYTSGSNLGAFLIREFKSDGTEIGTGVFPPFVVSTNDASPPKTIFDLDGRQFITPFRVNLQDTKRLVIAGASNTWESTNEGQTVAIVPGGPQFGRGFAYGHPNNPVALWATGGGGIFLRLTANDSLKPVPGYPDSSSWAVVMSPTNPASAYVTSDQHVYFTPDATATDAGVQWTDVTGDLASIGNGDGPGILRAIVYVPSPTTGDRIIVAASDATTASGSEKGVPGVFMMAVANPGVWTRVGTNLPNASAYDLVYDAGRDQLYVGTSGRGAWSVSGITNLNRAPIARCHDVSVNADSTCHATVNASDVDNGSSDPDGGGVTLTLAPNGPFGLGSTTVTLTVTDSQGASASCQATVTVVDRTPPVIGTVAPVTRTLCDPDGEPLTLTPPTATDNCTLKPTVTGTITASSDPRFPVPQPITGAVTLGVGTFTVTWTASDGTNSTTTSQTVTVRGGVFATQSADLRDRARVQQTSGGPASLLNSGSDLTHLGVNAQSGDVLSRGGIRLDDRAVVRTIARSAGGISLGNQVTIGTVLPNAPLTFPAPFSVTPGGFGSTGVTVQPGQTLSLAPGSYGNVVVYSGGRLNLRSGIYRFTGFDLEPQATLGLAQASGPIQIQVQSNLIWRGVETLSNGSITGFTLAYFGSNAASLEAPFTGVLVAPNALMTLGTDGTLTFAGQFYVKGLVATPDTVILCREDILP